MIALAPIHEDIRKTLFNRSQAVSRDFDGKDPLAEKSPHEDTFKSTFSKAIWVRVFSPVDSTVESIQKVGEEDKDGNPIFQKVHNSKKGLNIQQFLEVKYQVLIRMVLSMKNHLKGLMNYTPIGQEQKKEYLKL